MSTIGNDALSRVLSDYALPEQKKQNSKELGRDAFLKLLIAQLQNQDPTSPQDNGEFISQLAQFSQLEETQKMGQSFQQFSSAFQSTQHLQATSLVGRPVHVQSDVTMLGETGAVSVMANFNGPVQGATLSVFNNSGALIERFDLGAQSEGRQEFFWTGFDANDERFPQGTYRFELSTTQAGVTEVQPVYLSANVNSVTIEKAGNLTLNLAGVGPVPMSRVIQIN
jgi:flagellar basal-body rod modification protein FlgD